MKPLASWLLSARYEARRLFGAPGAIGLALLLLAGLLAAYAAPAWQAQRASLSRDSRRLAAQWQQRAQGGRELQDLAPAEQIRRFREGFPARAQALADLRLIGERAREHKVALEKGEYQMQRVQPGERGGLLSYDVVLPVKAGYPALRGFVGAVLNAAPHAALAELRMERANAGNAALDARIHFRFTYRDE